MKRTNSVRTVDNSWWWAQKMAETCRVLWQNKCWIFDASGWLFYKKLLEAFLIMSLRFARFNGEPFFVVVKSNFSFLGTDLKCWFIRISGLPDVVMKEFLCKWNEGFNIPHKHLCSFRRHMCNLKCWIPNYIPSRITLISSWNFSINLMEIYNKIYFHFWFKYSW